MVLVYSVMAIWGIGVPCGCRLPSLPSSEHALYPLDRLHMATGESDEKVQGEA